MSLNSWWIEDEGHNHRYDPVPEEPPRHRKKVKKRHVKSDHKHVYENVCIDAHSYRRTRDGRFPYLYIGSRCKICGRLYDWHSDMSLTEPPDDMPLYEMKDFKELMDVKFLTGDHLVIREDSDGRA